MKSHKTLLFLILILLVTACTAQAEVTAPPDSSENDSGATNSETSAQDPPDAAGVITDPRTLIGIWRGRPAGGILEIDENLQTTFAQNMDDLLGNRDVPTLYRGSLRMEGSTLYFEDSRCEEEGAGTYEVHTEGDNGIRFVLLEDACTDRVNNLMGQRIEPQIDVTWYPTADG